MSTENKSAAEMAAEIKADQQRAVDAVKAIAEEALGKAKTGEKLTTSLKEKADEALLKMNGLTEQVAELEQKMARGGNADPEEQKSFGEQFIEDESVKSWLDGSPSKGKADVRFKATITSATTNAAGSAGAGVPVTRLPGVLELPQRRLTVRDLLTQGRMDGNSLEYVRETGFVNNAAGVAEGGLKPSSDLKFDLVQTSAKVIAHWMKASRQILDDFSQLRSIIDQRLLYGLAYVEETQLLNGDGTGQNLHGILPQATSFAVPAGTVTPTPMTAIDTLRIAMLQAALAEYPATGHVLNPIDWAGIELTKDEDGRYIIGNPQGTAQPTMWGLPVVATQAMAAGTFLTGAFRLGAQVFDRWDARVEVGYVDDDFIRNLVTILAEERLALAVYRPEAFVTGSINPAPAGGGGG
ncbi:phage major capsid protein [Aquamicrobium zhengzhouense]|uniref:Phage major capsid protein n=1 Tax=Aquamicrobium zhengzhouense TaxID=2781738 RepID=A0ABS0SDX9_9HYPH|nr:phage major capsid protein [Aquamicrobium zhengzhouense]MBI1621495.1 phage major capsid protein [Aquamicrobium zhengzhouense]